MDTAGRRPLRVFPLLAVLSLPIVCTYIILYRQFVSIPLLDDYPSILGFAEAFQHQGSVLQKLLYIVAAQDNEYKLILMHAVVGLQLVTVGHISLAFLAAAGDLAPLCILGVLWSNSFREHLDRTQRLFLFIPVPFLLFQLNYAESFDWAMGTPQTLGVIACSLLSLHLLLRTGRTSFLWATTAAILACGASAGGFVLAPIGCIALSSHRRYRALLLWFAPFAIMLPAYAYRYVRVPAISHPSLSATILFFLSFAGGAYENMHHRPVPYLSIALGAGLISGLIFLFRTHSQPGNSFLYLSTLFIFGTIALASLGRSGMGLSQSLSGRYKIYSDLLLIFAYMEVAERLCRYTVSTKRAAPNLYKFAAASLVAAVLLYTGSGVVGYKFLSKRRSRLIEGLRQYEASPMEATPMLNPNEAPTPGFAGPQEQAREIMTRAINLGIYNPPMVAPRSPLQRPR